MIYVASVYSYGAHGDSHEDWALRHKRYMYAMKRTAEWLKAGLHVFSPIVHCNNMSLRFDMPKEYEFWKELDRDIISRCDKLYVLKMPNWEKSQGIADEIAWARHENVPVIYIECPDYEET